MSFNKPQGATISVNLMQQFHIFSHKWFLNMNRVETCILNKYLTHCSRGLKILQKVTEEVRPTSLALSYLLLINKVPDRKKIAAHAMTPRANSVFFELKDCSPQKFE